MELEVLRKKISTFRSKNGRVRITEDQLYMEILSAWENWPGTTADFYRAIEVSKTGMAGIIGKAKRMRREGHFPAADTFTEVRLKDEEIAQVSTISAGSGPIQIHWKDKTQISFAEVDQLIHFLNKMDLKAAA